MSIALIADAHIGGPGGPAGPLVEQLDALGPSACDNLVLMGDLFHVWVGDPRYETPEIVEVVDALRRLRGRGVRVDYIEGNRDFFLSGSIYADAFDGIHLEYSLVHEGRRFWFVHGDGLNDNDRQYRFWRWLSKSAPTEFLVRRVPGNIAKRLVHRTEQRLSRSNFKHKQEIPVQSIQRFAQTRINTDADVLVLGHFHEPHRIDVAGGEVWLLDAWFRHREMRWLTASGEVSR